MKYYDCDRKISADGVGFCLYTQHTMVIHVHLFAAVDEYQINDTPSQVQELNKDFATKGWVTFLNESHSVINCGNK